MKLQETPQTESVVEFLEKKDKKAKKKDKKLKNNTVTEVTAVEIEKKPRTRSVSLTLSESGIVDDLQELSPGTKTAKKAPKEKVKKVKVSVQDQEVKKEKKTKVSKQTAVNIADAKPVTDDGVPTEHAAGRFSNFPIRESTITKLHAKGIKYLFPIQVQTFKKVMEGNDVIAKARTGTGKTLAFALPLVEKLEAAKLYKRGRAPRVIVLAPTRELVNQVAKDFRSLSSGLSIHAFYGGVSFHEQRDALRHGIDVLVGTPGRVLDWVNREGQPVRLDTGQLEHVVLDEVDQMLDMGFADDVENIISHSYQKGDSDKKKPQTLFFSATLPRWVTDTAKRYMDVMPPVVDLVGNSVNQTATNVTHLAIRCEDWRQKASYISKIIQYYSGDSGRAMVFCSTKKDVDELARCPEIKQCREKLHGDVKQAARESVLEQFRAGTIKVLITTNVAARGLDIPEVDVVIQLEPPTDIDSYIHRSGRTGRAGKSGISVCLYKYRTEGDLVKVERFAKLSFKRVELPSADELASREMKDIFSSMGEMDDEVIERFRKTAKELIAERGAVDTVAALIAMATGQTKVERISLINSRVGFVTFLYTTNATLKFKSYVFNVMKNRCGDSVLNIIKHMTLTQDMKGAAFDVPVEDVEKIEASLLFEGGQDRIVRAKELPPMQKQLPPPSFNNYSPGPRWGPSSGRGGRFGGKRSYNQDSFNGQQMNNKRVKFD